MTLPDTDQAQKARDVGVDLNDGARLIRRLTDRVLQLTQSLDEIDPEVREAGKALDHARAEWDAIQTNAGREGVVLDPESFEWTYGRCLDGVERDFTEIARNLLLETTLRLLEDMNAAYHAVAERAEIGEGGEPRLDEALTRELAERDQRALRWYRGGLVVLLRQYTDTSTVDAGLVERIQAALDEAGTLEAKWKPGLDAP